MRDAAGLRPLPAAPHAPLGYLLAALAGVQLVALADRLDGLPLPLTSRTIPGGILLQGAVLGSLNALLAMGLVLLYRAGRFISFAQGQLGALAAVFGVALTQHYALPLWLGLLAGFALAALLGAVSELTVIRRLFDAPRLLVTVATIGLAQLFGTFTLLVPEFLDRNLSNSVDVGLGGSFFVDPVRFEGGSVLTLVAVPVVCVALAALFRSDLGVAIRAVSENPLRARLLGLGVRRVSTYTWVIAGGLAATTGILRALNPAGGFAYGSLEGPSLLLPAFAAALIGGMRSLPVTFAAAVGLGMVEQSVLFSRSNGGEADAVLFAVLLVALLVRRRAGGRDADAREATGFVATRAVRPIPRAVAALPSVRVVRAMTAAAAIAAMMLLPSVLSPSRLDLANSIVLVAMVALSLTVLTGYGGQVSLGQWALVGVGATVGAVLVERGLDFGLGLLLMALLGAVVSVVIGLPALRVQGLFLAVTTLAFALAVDRWLLTLDALQLAEPQIVRPVLFGLVDLSSGTAYYEFSLVVLALTLVAVVRLRRGPAGRAFVAVRDNPRAAASYGIRPGPARLRAFAISGAIACLAGYLYAFQQEVLVARAFSASVSLQVFAIVVIGGLGSVPGALLGTAYVLGIQFSLSESYQPLATGLGLLLLLLFLPEGLGGLLYRGRDAVVRRLVPRVEKEAA